MKTIHRQEEELFARYADVRGGKYMSLERITQLLGSDAVQYASNAADLANCPAVHCNIYGDTPVFTFLGFHEAFRFFRMMEIKEGRYNKYQTPDYLARPEFAG